ncbi:uncharacterized protein BCR38DRAFT_413511 [Pseudomassariella vexata]|uniref:Uncharacterized protein n=1 Tax=Pseudomassariella vexata TaxID=1141098 RepID=A0A1Y2DFV2_9PEZI|nr:uncharacterized protein BCR38DRAFT_413511 [Pseudomassariella vexata]ORY58099.1 hypothetical protein BCR38DRAFT_413511 [Pseudomassariella vexata]
MTPSLRVIFLQTVLEVIRAGMPGLSIDPDTMNCTDSPDESNTNGSSTSTSSASTASTPTGRRKRQRQDLDINTTISDESDDDNGVRQLYKRAKDQQRKFNRKRDRKKPLTDLGSCIERAAEAIGRPIGAADVEDAMKLLQSDGFVKNLDWRLRVKAYEEIGTNVANSVLYCQISDLRERRLWLLTLIGAKIDEEEVEGDGVKVKGLKQKAPIGVGPA